MVIWGHSNRFVTGTWDATDDAKTQLEEDDALYGDFEDLEAGASSKNAEDVEFAITDQNGKKDGEAEEDDDDEEAMAKKRAAKRKQFDEQYDNSKDPDEGPSYFDEMKDVRRSYFS